tara:strand:+ start:2483 stop:3010 length:528 start_codon:yes stop_codon:yes gene_type:complete
MSVISRSSVGTLDTGRLTALNSISSRMRESSAQQLETEEERFSRKLKQMTTLERELEVCKDNLKAVRTKHTKLENWVKNKMRQKAICDKTNRVEVASDNKVYTFERTKTYKNRGPTKTQIRNIIRAFFDEVDLAEFMAYSSQEKANKLFERMYTVGTTEKSSFRKRSIIRKPRNK